MTDALNPKKTTLSNMKSFPWQYAVYALCITVGFLFNKLGKSDDRNYKNAVSEAKEWKDRYFKLREDYDLLNTRFIISTEVSKSVVAKADSLFKSANNSNLKSK